MDAGNLLKPMLARGSLRCIGATTLDEYRQFIEKDPALERRFQQVGVHLSKPPQHPSQNPTHTKPTTETRVLFSPDTRIVDECFAGGPHACSWRVVRVWAGAANHVCCDHTGVCGPAQRGGHHLHPPWAARAL